MEDFYYEEADLLDSFLLREWLTSWRTTSGTEYRFVSIAAEAVL